MLHENNNMHSSIYSQKNASKRLLFSLFGRIARTNGSINLIIFRIILKNNYALNTRKWKIHVQQVKTKRQKPLFVVE